MVSWKRRRGWAIRDMMLGVVWSFVSLVCRRGPRIKESRSFAPFCVCWNSGVGWIGKCWDEAS